MEGRADKKEDNFIAENITNGYRNTYPSNKNRNRYLAILDYYSRGMWECCTMLYTEINMKKKYISKYVSYVHLHTIFSV